MRSVSIQSTAFNNLSTPSIAVYYSEPYDTQFIISFGTALYASAGTLTGTLLVQASNDIPTPGLSPGAFVPTNWSTISTQTLGNYNVFAPIAACYRWMRFAYNSTASGAGNRATAQVTMIDYR